MNENPEFRELLKRLADHFHPEKIFLFGSQAKGTATPESDYDVALIVADSPLSKLERMQEAQRILWGIWLPADIFVFTQQEFDDLVGVQGTIPSIVLQEGRRIYAA